MLPGKVNRLRIEVFNEQSMGVVENYVLVKNAQDAARRVGDLYLLASGVNHFPGLDPGVDLIYAAQDAEDMAASVQRAARGYYKRVHAQGLSDMAAVKPDKARIQVALVFFFFVLGVVSFLFFLVSFGFCVVVGFFFFVLRV